MPRRLLEVTKNDSLKENGKDFCRSTFDLNGSILYSTV